MSTKRGKLRAVEARRIAILDHEKCKPNTAAFDYLVVQSRHCDHMKEWRRIATAIYSVRPTWLNSGASGARPHIPSTKQAATATAANGQT